MDCGIKPQVLKHEQRNTNIENTAMLSRLRSPLQKPVQQSKLRLRGAVRLPCPNAQAKAAKSAPGFMAQGMRVVTCWLSSQPVLPLQLPGHTVASTGGRHLKRSEMLESSSVPARSQIEKGPTWNNLRNRPLIRLCRVKI